MNATTDIAVHEGGALAVQAGQTKWSEQQLAVLHSVGIEEDVSEAELDAFLHECQQRKLDPFSKQIYLIGRFDGRAQRKVYRSQTAIDGFRVISHRAADEARKNLSYEDTLWCGYDGVWHDVWLSNEPPAAAKVVVLSNGDRYPGIATLAEYAALYPSGDPMPMWKRMPSTMLAKCAEALALRKAFPDDLSGIYTAEEMAQADNPVNIAPVPQQPERKADRQRPAAPQPDEWTRPAPDIEDAEEIEPSSELPPPLPLVPTASKAQLTKLSMLLAEKRGLTDRDACVATVAKMVNRGGTLTSRSQLSKSEASGLIETLTAEPDHVPLPDNPVRDILADGIAAANSPATLDEAGRDVTNELTRGSITPGEAEHLRGQWRSRKGQLQAEHAQLAGATA